jgi:predicted 3-demethylubiquinone-9 3-methyltransferase (glyoxalase superfamily)
MQKISPFLWFDANAEEAVNFYTAIFKNSKIKDVSRYGDAGPGPKGQVMVMNFDIEGQDFVALNGGPRFQFTEAVSFVVHCKGQQEVDHYWDKLLEGGGQTQACGWLKDRFGLSWQIVPDEFFELMKDKDPAVRNRVMQAMMGMIKFDVEGLKRAAEGK